MSDPNILMKKIKRRERVKSEKLKMKNAQNNVINGESKKSPGQMTKKRKSLEDEAPTKKKLKKKKIESDNEEEKEEEEVEEEDSEEQSADEENVQDQDEAETDDNNVEPEDNSSQKLPGSSIGFDISANAKFTSLEGKVSEGTLKAIKEMGFENMTKIQAKSLPPLLEGRDICGAAKTGSGKTLAFLIPAIELIVKLKFMPRNGTGCIILSPTRELAMQTYGVLKELMKHHYNTYGLLMGGASRQTEAQKLTKGINIIVVTPGRLLDHLQNTPDFLFKNLQCLIIDEADRMLADGFEEELKQIIKILPKKRQTMLFSATQTKKTESLTALALKKEPIYVGVDDDEERATVDGLEQGYVVCPSDKRFLLLFTFLKKNRNKKVMVFFSSCMSVKYHHELLNYIDLPVMSIHGKQKQSKRTTTFYQFGDKTSGILLCTDVAARGLDIPDVDWIVQFDPPDDPKEYIHRVGRTARAGSKGHALLILRPEEIGFLRYLKAARVPVNEFDFSWNKISNIQPQIEKLITSNYFLNQSAKEAFKAYVRAYDSHHLKQIFDVETLDLNQVGKSFGFAVPPPINLRVGTSQMSRQKNRSAGGGYGYNRNGNNGGGRQKENGKNFRQGGGRRNNDSRQFSR